MTKAEAFAFLDRQARGIAATFGECCETVGQEIVGNELIVAAIYNGHVSGREVGSNIGIPGGTLDTSQMDIHDIVSEDLNQLTIHPSGKKIKSSDFVLRGEGYTYILGINYAVTLLIEELNKRNSFELQKSVPYLSERLGVSKYTLYKDLNELRNPIACHGSQPLAAVRTA